MRFKPYSIPFLGHIPWMIMQPTECLLNILGNVSHGTPVDQSSILRLGQKSWIVSRDPNLMLDILTRHRKTFPRGRTLDEVRAICMGFNGINEADGEEWLLLRRVLQSGFDSMSYQSMGERLQRICREFIDQLHDGQIVDAHNMGSRFAMAGICGVLFGYDINLSRKTSPLLEEQDYITKQLMIRYKRTPLWKYLPLPSNFKVRLYAKRQLAFLADLVHSDNAGSDLIDTLKSARENEKISEMHLLMLMSNLLGAGTETTATSLQWVLHFLSRYPEWQDDLKCIPRVIDEVLRLRPSIPVILRESAEEQRVRGINFRKGDFVACLVNKIHTNPQTWGRDSFEFKPGRFANNRYTQEHFKNNYFPFGAGPRQCIGSKFAKLEMKLFLEALLKEYRVESAYAVDPKPVLEFSWKPKKSLAFRLIRRGM